MSGRFVVVRMQSDETPLGEALAAYPEAVATCVAAGVHEHQGRRFADHLALVEGLPDGDLARLLLRWASRFGEAPQVIGGPFALRLPVELTRAHSPTVEACLRLGALLPDVRQRIDGGVLELWSPFPTVQQAEAALAALQGALHGLPVLWAGTAEARPADLECWAVLGEAAQVVRPDCLVPA